MQEAVTALAKGPAHANHASARKGRLPESLQFLGFVAVGVFCALVSLGTRYLANFLVAFETAVVIAHAVGMIFSFTFNRFYIFPATNRPIHDELAKFVVVNLLSVTFATIVGSFFYRIILPAIGVGWNDALIAHSIGMVAAILPSFLGYKYFTFRRNRLSAKRVIG